MKYTRAALGFLLLVPAAAYAVEELPVEHAVLTDAPQVPPLITRSAPARVIVDLEVKEVQGELADGVQYTFWTFGGKVPGKFIRVREGDTVEMRLANHPANHLPHNIDLHAVTGPGGGAASTFTAPGHRSTFTFKALNPGLYVYHCATAPVGMHIANGMYGLIYVQPEISLPPVDREYYVMQGEFYTAGAYGEKGLQQFAMQKAIDERPPYVVFNGGAASLTGERALEAKTGERVRLFVGNGGPNLVSSFHVIGAIFENVFTEGGIKPNQHDVQTTIVPSGGASIVEFKAAVPGNLVMVDHSIFRAFNKGALGMLKVSGPENKSIYSGNQKDEPYRPDGYDEAQARLQPAALKAEPKPVTKESLIADGKDVFARNCAVCHQPDGAGMPGVFPPLAKSDFLGKLANAASRDELIGILLNGKTGKISVNGTEFNGQMPAIGAALSDADIAGVLTYVSNSWGNQAERAVMPAEVAGVRAREKAHVTE